MKTFSLAVPVLLAAAVGGCVPKIEDDLSTISKPRILAIRTRALLSSGSAGPAEIGERGQATVDALVAAPEEASVPGLDYRLCLARKPLTELGPVNEACLVRSADRTVELPLGVGDGVRVQIPRDACSLFGPVQPSATEGQPAGRPVDPDVTGGYYQPVVAFLGDEDRALGATRLDCGLGSGVSSAARREFTARYHPNENPELDSVAIVRGTEETPLAVAGTAALVVAPGTSVSLRAKWAKCPRAPVCGDGQCSPGETKDVDVSGTALLSCPADCATEPRGCPGAESYVWLDPTTGSVATRREGITVSWYVTGGTIDERRTGVTETDPDVSVTETSWTSPEAAGSVTLFVVIRDDRGGVSWGRYVIRISR